MTNSLEDVIVQIEFKLDLLESEREKLRAQIEQKSQHVRQLRETLQNLKALMQELGDAPTSA